MKMKLYAIIGSPNARKSSCIRALTGAAVRGFYTMATAHGLVKCFVQIKALQEDGRAPGAFTEEMRQAGAGVAIISLRIRALNRQGHNYPAGIEYLNQFVGVGWDVRPIVVLGLDEQGQEGQALAGFHPHFFQDAANLPTNQTAAQIRRLWEFI